MKVIKIFTIVFLTCCFISCQVKIENSNVELTDFTKELISLYINDVENINVRNRKDEIIIISLADTSYYTFSVFANNSKEFKFCREDFIGQTVYLGHSIRVFGNESSIFYSLKEKVENQRPCKDHSIEYDPKVWYICFYRDKSFSKMRTYKFTPSKDITAIQCLADKYFQVSRTIENEIYQSFEVEIEPKFLLGENSIRQIITSNFKIHKVGNFGKVPILVEIIVDKKGKASLKGIAKSSNDIELDNEAIRVTEIICQHDFIPASHRGEAVNSIFPIVFLESDIALH